MKIKHHILLFVISLFLLSSCYHVTVKAAEVHGKSTGTVTLDLFVMSYCPYAVAAEREIVHFVKESRDKVNFNVFYIAGREEGLGDGIDSGTHHEIGGDPGSALGCRGNGKEPYLGFYSLHGRAEIEENMRQLLIRALYPDVFLDYLLLRTDRIEGDWRESAIVLGIDVDLVEEMIKDGTGESLLAENIRVSKERRITSSPTLFIDDVPFTNSITYSALKKDAGISGEQVLPESNQLAGEHSISGPEDGGFHLDRVGTGNPAAVYCYEMGYEYRIIDDGQRGICVLPDGGECDDWAFLQGKCGQSYSYCRMNGYDIITLTDGRDPFSREYAICISGEGKRIGSVTDLMHLSRIATKASIHTFQNGNTSYAPMQRSEVPSSFDWRAHNGFDWITPVKNQGGCGSCWAFSTVGTVEAMFNINSNDPDLDLDLSEEYLVSDCHTGSFMHQNCCGGSDAKAFNFIRKQGIPDDSCMHYVDGFSCTCGGGSCDGNCNYRTGTSCSDKTCSERCSDWEERIVEIQSNGSTTDIKGTITGIGPVSAGIGIGSGYGGYWDGDVYRCTNDSGINHVIVLVGYNDAGGYWIAKNSWGTGWEEDGFFKVGYGECSIENSIHYADTPKCGTTLTEDIVLYHDILDCTGDALIIAADDITVDCNGHTIDGVGSNSGIILENREGVTVKNCTVRDFDSGISLISSNYNDITENIVIENRLIGLYLDNSLFNSIWNNEFMDNSFNAYEEGTANSNSWHAGLKGNYWSDFESNAGYPNSYMIPGPGDGIDPWPNDAIPRHREKHQFP